MITAHAPGEITTIKVAIVPVNFERSAFCKEICYGTCLEMNYYHIARLEIQPLLPKSVNRILDVGAGAGVTLAWLKTVYPKAETTGVELNTSLADELKKTRT